MAMLDSFIDDFPLHPSLHIPPLLDPSPPAFAARSALPSPLEPDAHVNIDLDIETAKLSGRRKALAEAKPIGGPAKSSELRPIQRGPRKRQKLQEYERIADFVQLPEPKQKAKNDTPRPFQPVSVLNELHEPPPSAALFPPITPNEPTHEHSRSLSSLSLLENAQGEDDTLLANRSVGQKVDGQSQRRTSQRPRMKWTTLETEHLQRGVELYGIGKWKKILHHPGFSFQPGRTPVDLKDHHRTKLKSLAARKSSDPGRSKTDTSSNTTDSFWNSVINTPSSPPCESQLGTAHPDITTASGSNRKGTWTELEDENLEKGYKKYGFGWTRIAKDPELDLAHRTGPQVRDRFRTKFPALYGEDQRPPPRRERRENPEHLCRGTAYSKESTTGDRPTSSRKRPELESESSKDSDLSADPIAASSPNRPSASSAYNILGLLNSDGEDDRPSSGLPLDTWDTNVTLPPLLWEEIATRPMFDLE